MRRSKLESLTDDQLRIIRSRNEIRALCSGLFVVAALVIEVALAWWYGGVDQWYEPPAAIWGPVLASALIALGVFGQLHFGRAASAAAKELEKRLEKEAAEARRDSAAANELLKSSEKEAAEARLETERLKAQFSWRRLSPSALEGLRDVLHAAPKYSVQIVYLGNDYEAQYFASQLADLFNALGWHVALGSIMVMGRVPFGLRVPTHTPPNTPVTDLLQAALAKAGIEFEDESIPRWSWTTADAPRSPFASIFVGPKFGMPIPEPATAV